MTASEDHETLHLYIDGQWQPSTSTETIDVENPATGTVIGTIADGSAADVDAAVAAARRAFRTWSAKTRSQRAALLNAMADAMEAQSERLAELVTCEVGMPIEHSRVEQVPTGEFRNAAVLAEDYPFERPWGTTLVIREPVGVVGAITPWNYPLHEVVAKVAPAMAAGCPVVVKSSELAPLSVIALAEIADQVGLPPGVFNLISGRGTGAGAGLAAHPEVDLVSFTGSTSAGREVAMHAASRIVKSTLELGGKSALLVLDDADLERAVAFGVGSCYKNSGQTCDALTRLVIPRQLLCQAEEVAVATARSFVVGDPVAPETTLGPLISGTQRERVWGLVERGVAEGARLLTGGARPPAGLEEGYFTEPTVFADVTPSMTIAREEVFGPVLSILAYDDEAEAVEIANGTDYGLWGSVWSQSTERALSMARQLRCGGVGINDSEASKTPPFGGYKNSGLGRQYGPWGLEEFCEIKSLVGGVRQQQEG